MLILAKFGGNPSAYIQDTVNDLTTNFAGLKIRKSRVAECMKEDCNLSIKTVSRFPVAGNSEKTMQEHAIWVEKWVNDSINYFRELHFY